MALNYGIEVRWVHFIRAKARLFEALDCGELIDHFFGHALYEIHQARPLTDDECLFLRNVRFCFMIDLFVDEKQRCNDSPVI